MDFVRRWSEKTEISAGRFIAWVGVSASKFYNWRERYGRVNEHNGWVPRDFWLEPWEKEAIVSFHLKNPLEGYRRLTFMMLDADVVAVSPSSVWRVLKQAGLLSRWKAKPSRKGTGFEQPLAPHQHWHVDVSYINLSGTFYYLCSVLDGCSWKESTITANSAPTLGSAIASAVPVTTTDKNQYVLVDVTAAAVDWLNGTTNDGLAIVPDGAVSFALNSKETTTTSHPAELDVVLTGPAGPPGPISGVTAGAGLAGGGTKGNVTLSLLTTCSSGQVLQWNGSTWVCATASGSGTITGVTAGTDLTGGGTNGTVTLNLDTTKVPQLATANNFVGNQAVTGNLNVASTGRNTKLQQFWNVVGAGQQQFRRTHVEHHFRGRRQWRRCGESRDYGPHWEEHNLA